MKKDTLAALPKAERIEDTSDPFPPLSSWGFIEDTEEGRDGIERKKHLACVTHRGSNFISVKAGRTTWRVHIDNLEAEFQRISLEEAREYIAAQVNSATASVQKTLKAIHELSARIGAGERDSLTENIVESTALTIGSTRPVKEFEADLVKARDKTLPELFSKLRKSHENLAAWMAYEALPYEAKLSELQATTERINQKVFTVKLYAGLEEELVCINPDAAPASNDEPLHLWQARRYVDEEFMARWRAGGATASDVDAFFKWLAEPANLKSVLPFPRTVVAFRVRREAFRVEPGHPLYPLQFSNPMYVHGWHEENKATMLAMRNGDQLWYLSVPFDFGDHLFPSLNNAIFSSGKQLFFKKKSFGEFDYADESGVKSRCTDEGAVAVRNYIQERRQYNRFKKHLKTWQALPAGERKDASTPYYSNFNRDDVDFETLSPPKWREMTKERRGYPYRVNAHQAFANAYDSERTDWLKLNDKTVYFDDMKKHLADEANAHNNIVLVLQGLLDRSQAFHPHPPWQLFREEGFTNGLVLHFDEDKALVDGVPPDFERYVRENQKSIKVGSLVYGADLAWRRRNAAREQRQAGYRRSSWDRSDREFSSGMYGDKGPGDISKVVAVRAGKAIFEWSRDKARWDRYGNNTVRDRIAIPLTDLFNVEKYTPGDMHRFMKDPRTRRFYLAWGDMLTSAEEWHAEGKPDPTLRGGNNADAEDDVHTVD